MFPLLTLTASIEYGFYKEIPRGLALEAYGQRVNNEAGQLVLSNQVIQLYFMLSFWQQGMGERTQL